MERQRNKPVKYNRELVHKSVKAMQKVEEVCFSIGLAGISLHSNTRLQCLHRPSTACVRQTCKMVRQEAPQSSFSEMLFASSRLLDCIVCWTCRFGWQGKIGSMRQE